MVNFFVIMYSLKEPKLKFNKNGGQTDRCPPQVNQTLKIQNVTFFSLNVNSITFRTSSQKNKTKWLQMLKRLTQLDPPSNLQRTFLNGLRVSSHHVCSRWVLDKLCLNHCCDKNKSQGHTGTQRRWSGNYKLKAISDTLIGRRCTPSTPRANPWGFFLLAWLARYSTTRCSSYRRLTRMRSSCKIEYQSARTRCSRRSNGANSSCRLLVE